MMPRPPSSRRRAEKSPRAAALSASRSCDSSDSVTRAWRPLLLDRGLFLAPLSLCRLAFWASTTSCLSLICKVRSLCCVTGLTLAARSYRTLDPELSSGPQSLRNRPGVFRLLRLGLWPDMHELCSSTENEMDHRSRGHLT